jgi:FemAB-related protein (PEP-CTERM system-associated)
MKTIVQIHRDESSSWDTYVASHEESTNYHRYGWREVVEQSFGHRTYYLAAKTERGDICGVLPLVHMKSPLFGTFLVSLPFFNYGGLLCDVNDTSSLLLESSRNICEMTGSDYLELRHLRLHNSALATRQHKVTMLLELGRDEETAWKALDAKVRNQVRKAEKSGLRVTVGRLELLDGFYDVFCRNMRDLGTPVYGKSFFRNVLKAFPDSTCVISVTLDGKTVASGIMTWFRDTLELPWASSLRDHRALCPNNLLYWEAIKFAIGSGSKYFDFGRSTPDGGTYRFKSQWGARPVPLYWQYLLNRGVTLPELNPANPRYARAIRLWQQLPVTLTRILGPMIVRNIP